MNSTKYRGKCEKCGTEVTVVACGLQDIQDVICPNPLGDDDSYDCYLIKVTKVPNE